VDLENIYRTKFFLTERLPTLPNDSLILEGMKSVEAFFSLNLVRNKLVILDQESDEPSLDFEDWTSPNIEVLEFSFLNSELSC
jgi:hypothetical protein